MVDALPTDNLAVFAAAFVAVARAGEAAGEALVDAAAAAAASLMRAKAMGGGGATFFLPAIPPSGLIGGAGGTAVGLMVVAVVVVVAVVAMPFILGDEVSGAFPGESLWLLVLAMQAAVEAAIGISGGCVSRKNCCSS